MPMIPIRLKGANGEAFDTMALVDSGADYSVIFSEHAEILGIDLAKLEQTDAMGVGGKVDAWRCKIETEISGKAEHRKYRMLLPFLIIQKPAENHPILLGRAGFFEEFEIIFKEKRREVVLKPVE